MKVADNGMNEVLVVSPILEEYIRKNYPGYKVNSSTCKAIKDIDIDDNAFKGIEAIINSMTPKERSNPDIINQSRRVRIAKGSGTNIQEVNRLLKQFDQMKKMMKMVNGMDRSRMLQMAAAMKNMKGGMPGM